MGGSARRFHSWRGVLVVLAAVVLVSGSTAAPGKPTPRIVSASMRDVNNDSRDDELVLVYSARIHHRADRDGQFPFTVVGYRIRAVDAANGKTLAILLRERPQADGAARPRVRYHRTTLQPVLGPGGTQAATQVFAKTKARRPPKPPPPPPPTTTTPANAPPAPADTDHDGVTDDMDCAPKDPTIHPGAHDVPDLSFVDSNCDGIDGSVDDALFVSPNGKDSNPGTKDKPMRQIQPAVVAAAIAGKREVVAAAGTYTHVTAETGVGIYGGYEPANWSHRSTKLKTTIAGSPEGVLADDRKAVLLQLLTVMGTNSPSTGLSAYGIRAINDSSLTLQHVAVVAGDGASGGTLQNPYGAAGRDGSSGGDGQPGHCDDDTGGGGGAGGKSGGGGPPGEDGHGGHGGGGGDPSGTTGTDGRPGNPSYPAVTGTPAGTAGRTGTHGTAGHDGQAGRRGGDGTPGFGGQLSFATTPLFRGDDGTAGEAGSDGFGGGGGGGGGAQAGPFVSDGTGNGGGGGGEGGSGGWAGTHAGGSFGIYLLASSVVVDSSSITTGNGGAGGSAQNGFLGGAGGNHGAGGSACLGEIGAGGNGGAGGHGGNGGGGGGGVGGPSIGIIKLNYPAASTATVKNSTITVGTAGKGGVGGQPGGLDGGPGVAVKIFPMTP